MLLDTAAAIVGLFLYISAAHAANSTYQNPILPGFYPDPSCIFVPDWNETYFCASSSFNAFPGIPIHASKDLRQWKLISNAFSRPEQLPNLATTNRSTGGIWAPTLRYDDKKFWIATTLVFDDLPKDNTSRWDNFVVSTSNPFDSKSWSDPVHFKFPGYDTSLFWEEGKVYVTGSHQYSVWPGILTAEIDLQSGAVGDFANPWNGTGGLAPEGPHIYKKDGYHYLMLAEGGTGLGHMVTMARSEHGIHGPYVPAPHNPVLSNANSTEYFQAVGHADLFQDQRGNWWGVALSIRTGPDVKNNPMGRETVLTPVTWNKGDWPVFSKIQGNMEGWPLPSPLSITGGDGPYIGEPEHLTFPPGSPLPAHLLTWRLQTPDTYIVSPPGHKNQLAIRSSALNLTAYDGYYTGGKGQTYIGRRQEHSLFSYTVDIDASRLQKMEDEVGVSLFLVMRYHFDLGVVLLPTSGSTAPKPHFRFRGISGWDVPEHVVPVPESYDISSLSFEISAFNSTYFSLNAGPSVSRSKWQTYGYARGDQLTWGFTGSLVGVFATSNGRGENGEFEAYISNWRYKGYGQIVD